ncbi:lipoyl(octanoyl) transferase LipB [Candidatus Magnetaquicoccus inordinatus]|uniref:lipoyl(octanoyl) transferase LipB n=1 Tax=Candidatus Magnetaquicoccus inordinatus TaxID=2496818 RepID=UPI00102CA513|nr:lipoyl(octanoyl) transferase LipB [Candidatus Magnetaquicoccus inordinatus]
MAHPLLWLRSQQVHYAAALRWQKQQVEIMLNSPHKQPDRLLFLEHPSVYTIGRSGRLHDLLPHQNVCSTIPVLMTDRGGKITYHGPGQLVAYLLRDLRPHALMAARKHLFQLEEVVIRCLASLGLQAVREQQYPGVWVGDAKIAAVGVRIKQGITYHGISLNRDPDLRFYEGIVPCGLPDRPVTSLSCLGISLTREALEELLLTAFCELFQYEVVDLPMDTLAQTLALAES